MVNLRDRIPALAMQVDDLRVDPGVHLTDGGGALTIDLLQLLLSHLDTLGSNAGLAFGGLSLGLENDAVEVSVRKRGDIFRGEFEALRPWLGGQRQILLRHDVRANILGVNHLLDQSLYGCFIRGRHNLAEQVRELRRHTADLELVVVAIVNIATGQGPELLFDAHTGNVVEMVLERLERKLTF